MGSLPGGISDVSLVLFQMLENLPLAQISSFVAIILLIVFFVTSSDSGSLVIDSITSGGKLHAPVPQRIFWATMEGLVAIVLLAGGGATALSSLQAGAIAAGLPFTIVLLVCCVSRYLGLKNEPGSISRHPGYVSHDPGQGVNVVVGISGDVIIRKTGPCPRLYGKVSEYEEKRQRQQGNRSALFQENGNQGGNCQKEHACPVKITRKGRPRHHTG